MYKSSRSIAHLSKILQPTLKTPQLQLQLLNRGKNLNLRVIAEGVEHDGQLEFLRGHRCDEIQGYIFSKPLIAAKVEEMLLKQEARSETAGSVGSTLHQAHPLRARRPSLRRSAR